MKITHYEKAIRLEGATQFGYLKIYFGHPDKFKVLSDLAFDKFTALSHMLSSSEVHYNPDHKVFYTRHQSEDLNSFLEELEMI